MWWTYALLSALFAALTAVLAKVGVRGVSADLATAVRTSVVLALAWGIVFFREQPRELLTLAPRTWFFLGLSGLATGLSWLCYFRALQLGPVTRVAPVDKLSVALTIVLSIVFLGETLTLKAALGATLIIGGTLLLIF